MAEDKHNEEFKDLKDQFKEMHESLDKLVEAQKPVAKVARAQISHDHRPTARGPKVELGKETLKELAKANKETLKAMQGQLRRTQMEQGATMGDVAAEHLAGGGGIGGAAKAAMGLKVAQLKHKFDPLNIVKKVTGGSRLLTALAGKVMGRSEKSVRSFADLAPGMDLPTPFFGRGMGSPSMERSSGRGGDSAPILTKMASTLSQMLARLTNIETIQRLSAKLSQQQIDAERDAGALAGASRKPSRLGGVKEKVKEVSNTAFDFIKDLIGNFKLGLVGAFALLGVAAGMLIEQWDKLKLSFTLLKESAVGMWEGVKRAFSDAGSWISNKATQFLDVVKDMFDTIVEYVQDLLYTISFGKAGKKAATPEERMMKLSETAKGGGPDAERAQRKLQSLNDEKVATPNENSSAIAKFAQSFASKIPTEAKSSAAEGLKSGQYDAAASASLLGRTAPVGTPQERATIGAVTQLVSKSYGEVFKDKQGNPLTPRTDDPELAAKRVPSMVREATKTLGMTLSTSTPPTAVSSSTPPTVGSLMSPTELAPVDPQTGLSLAQASDFQRAAAMSNQMVGTGGSGGMVINNVKNSHSNITNLQQSMPDPRSGETSYLRSLDRGFSSS